MTPMERLVADFRNTGLTIGAHPMRFYRERLQRQHIRRAAHGNVGGEVTRLLLKRPGASAS
jgi:hypothetical protein